MATTEDHKLVESINEGAWERAWKQAELEIRLRAVVLPAPRTVDQVLDAHFAKMAPTIAAINAGMKPAGGKP